MWPNRPTVGVDPSQNQYFGAISHFRASLGENIELGAHILAPTELYSRPKLALKARNSPFFFEKWMADRIFLRIAIDHIIFLSARL